MKNRSLSRIIDANINRATEGLRVCEDILRFAFNEKKLTRQFKKLRHQIHQTLLTESLTRDILTRARDSVQDVGKQSVIRDQHTVNWTGLLSANLKRSEESLRVLEECSKMVSDKMSRSFQRCRFRAYELEKKALKIF